VLGKINKLVRLRSQKKKKITGYIKEEIHLCGHVFEKSVRYIFTLYKKKKR
jgi:hypothetical protein